jgi:UDP-N-acetylmuramoylalanine--D-glutamate ligase
MIEFKGKKVSVIGAARSGLASAVALKKLGATVFLSELKDVSSYSEMVRILKYRDIKFEFGGHSDNVFDCQLMVTSPGVPSDSEVLNRAHGENIKIISELELGFLLCPGRIIAITGSNGKTTTTSLIGEIFSHSGINYRVAGNIGKPFVAIAANVDQDGWAILEVSTFQLEWIDRFKPKVAAVLNITPDHLDRHHSMEDYVALKLKVFSNQNGTDLAVLNADDKNLQNYKPVSEVLHFSVSGEIENGCYVEKDALFLNRYGRKEMITSVDKIGIKGPHNLANACAAVACSAVAGINTKSITAGLRSFMGVEHRLEEVGLIGGVSFINDSKATNVDAVYQALQSVSPPVVLIAGGLYKGGDFSVLHDLVKKYVNGIVLIGEASGIIADAFENITPLYDADSLEEAVRTAYEIAGSQGTVLLSPGCASFDMFENFEHRGHIFKLAVNKLKTETESAC